MGRPANTNLTGSLWHADSVQDVAQSVGLSSLSDDVAQALAGDVEFRLHQVIEEAMKFAHHAKRDNLTVLDLDLAFRAKNIEPLFGFLTTAPGGGNAEYRRLKLPATATAASSVVYYLQDEEIDLQKVLATPLPPVPREVSYSAHWLAIEGVQPAIPQNPLAHEITQATKNTSSNSQRASTASNNQRNDNIDVRPLIKHVLSRELQLYYDRVTAACLDADEALRSAALSSFRSDSGLSGLVPYLVQWAAEKVVQGAIPLLGSNDSEAGFIMDCVLAAVFAMLQNKTLFVEPYLHQIMPTVLTCLLNDALPSSLASTRDQAASLLAFILSTYAGSYPSLKPRILKTLLRALVEPDRTPGTRLGAVIGIASVGTEAIASVLAQEANLISLGTNLAEHSSDPDANECAARAVAALSSLPKSTPAADSEAMDVSETPNDADLLEKYGEVLGRHLARHSDILGRIRSAA